jgi:hypothetical protein
VGSGSQAEMAPPRPLISKRLFHLSPLVKHHPVHYHLPRFWCAPALPRQRCPPEGQQALAEYCKGRAILNALLPLTEQDCQRASGGRYASLRSCCFSGDGDGSWRAG